MLPLMSSSSTPGYEEMLSSVLCLLRPAIEKVEEGLAGGRGLQTIQQDFAREATAALESYGDFYDGNVLRYYLARGFLSFERDEVLDPEAEGREFYLKYVVGDESRSILVKLFLLQK